MDREDFTLRCARAYRYCACAKHSGPLCVSVPPEPPPPSIYLRAGHGPKSTYAGLSLFHLMLDDTPFDSAMWPTIDYSAPAPAKEDPPVVTEKWRYRVKDLRDRVAAYRAALPLSEEPEK